MYKPTIDSALPSPLVFHVLQALSDQERHGYAIIQQIKACTEGAVRLGPGALCRSLKQSLGHRWIEVSGEYIDPALDAAPRRYYRLTAAGLKVLNAVVRQHNRTRNRSSLWFVGLKPQVIWG